MRFKSLAQALRLLAGAAALAWAALACSAAEPPGGGWRPLRVVLLADKKDHGPAGNGLHDYPLWQARWSQLLGSRAASGATNVTVEQAWEWPAERQFAEADVIAAFCYLPWSDARKRQVAGYLARGGGLVVIHSATWTKPKADSEVAALVGVGGFSRYRHGEVRLEVADPDHPICRGLPRAAVLDDETYWPPTPEPDLARVRVLAVSQESGENGNEGRQPQPQLWTYEPARGRVFGCVPGHRAQTFDDPWLRLALLRGIAWAAGEPPHRFDGLAPRGARSGEKKAAEE